MSWFGEWDGFDEEMQSAPDIFARKPQTNADRIRAMTDEELAEFWCKWAECWTCPIYMECVSSDQIGEKLIINWLKSEAT